MNNLLYIDMYIMNDCCDKRAPAVWSKSQEHHPDYAKFVLRNGQVDKNTFESYLNNSNTEFLENAPKGAMYMRQHKFKEDGNLFRFNDRGDIEMDDDYRRDLWNRKQNLEKSDEPTFQLEALIREFPDVVSGRTLREKIQEINRGVPMGVPNRQSVVDELVRDHVLSLYRLKLGVIPASGQKVGERLDNLASSIAFANQSGRIGMTNILNRLTQIQLAQEASQVRPDPIAVKSEEEAFGEGAKGRGIPTSVGQQSSEGSIITLQPSEGTIRTRDPSSIAAGQLSSVGTTSVGQFEEDDDFLDPAQEAEEARRARMEAEAIREQQRPRATQGDISRDEIMGKLYSVLLRERARIREFSLNTRTAVYTAVISEIEKILQRPIENLSRTVRQGSRRRWQIVMATLSPFSQTGEAIRDIRDTELRIPLNNVLAEQFPELGLSRMTTIRPRPPRRPRRETDF